MKQILSRDNEKIKLACKLLSQKKVRAEHKMFVIEGFKMVQEAVLSNVELLQIFYTRPALERFGDRLTDLFSACSECYEISPAVSEKLAQTAAPQGVYAVCRLLDKAVRADKIVHNGRYLVLCGLQDPGNVGTVIRTAEAFGLDGLFLTGGCPDLFSPKMLRATMGSVFRLPVYVQEDPLELIARFQEKGCQVFAAALCETAVPLDDSLLQKGAAVFIGNEGNGLPQQVVSACDQALLIPMRGRAQSLNAAVAAAVILWEMTKDGVKA